MRKSGRPTMVDVAAAAGVSLKTVSRVINGEPHVDASLVDRVQEAATQLGYRRNALAASLRSGSGDTIGFVSADLSNTFYMRVAAGVSSEAVRRGMHVVMASSEEDAATERRLALELCQRRVSGLILVPAASDHSYLAHEVELGTPVVFLDRPGEGVAADTILIDNRGGARTAIAELLAAGHERIALLFDALDIFTMGERYRGAKEAFAAAGRSIDPGLVVTGLHDPRAAHEATHRLLDSPAPPTAVFCANNRVTTGTLEAVISRDAELAISGFDDFELASLLPRRIRVVSYDEGELGRRAAATLLDRIVGTPATPGAVQLMPTRLIDRGGRR